MQKSTIELLKTKLIFPIRNAVIDLNRRAGRFDQVVWLIGDGRSGTTWVASLINSSGSARELFEPYHPEVVKNTSLQPYYYTEKQRISENLLSIYSDIFSGRLLHRRIDFDNRKLLYKGLIVKDIFINLSAFSICQKFKHVKPIFLIRNPFAVVHSKLQKKHWFWPADLSVYLNNSLLMSRVSPSVRKLISEAHERNNFIEVQFIHWALGNSIVLEDFKSYDLHIVFYEDMKRSPNDEIKKIKEYLGAGFTFVSDTCNPKVFDKPSRVTGKVGLSSKLNTSSDDWLAKFGERNFDLGINVLKTFNWLDSYSEDGNPNHQFFKKYSK